LPEHRSGRGGRRRAGIGIVDQLLYSFGNFALTVVVAREVSAAAFGTYSLIIATYLISVAIVRGLTSETLVVRFSAADRSSWRDAARDATGASLVLGVVLGALMVAASFFTHGSLATTGLTVGIFLPGLVLQDTLRFAALAHGRPALALVNDATQAVVQFGALAVLITSGNTKVWQLVSAWGGAAYVAALVGALSLRLAVRPFGVFAWFRAHGDLAGKYALDDLASQGSQQVTVYVVAGAAGLTDAGGLRGAQTVFGPPSILNVGVQAAVTPELVRILRTSTRRLHSAVLYLGLGLAAVGAVWGVLALFIPDRFGHQLFGDTWAQAQPLLVFFVVAQTTNGFRVAPMAGLRALGAANRTLLARSFVIGVGLIFQVAGAVLDGAHGVAVAIAIVTPIQAVAWWAQFEIALREHRREVMVRRVEETWNRLVDSAPITEGDTADVLFGRPTLPMSWPGS
jgi:O-antigen/teichoic acid export membrane protein